jgi:plastocyanin
MKHVTGSLVVCSAAALFTAGALLFADDSPRTTAAAAPAPGGGTLTIADFTFTPLSVPAGATVTVANADGVQHTATATDGSFDTGILDGGGSITFVAPGAAGTYSYVCQVHPTMQGTLIVV